MNNRYELYYGLRLISNSDRAGGLRNLEQQAFGIANYLNLKFENPEPWERRAGVHSTWEHQSIEAGVERLILTLVQD